MSSIPIDSGKINAENYLGGSYEKYRRELTQLALKNSDQYFAMRESIEASLTKVSTDLYNNLFDVLVHGEIGGAHVVTIGTKTLKPGVPSNKANEIALGIARSLREALIDVTNELVPLDLEKIIQSKHIAVSARAFSGP